ncbi:MAG: hypothetical protein LBC75_00200 [Fibromonadaceae bacterium]|jgi:predicted RNA-binding protein with PIN domain|nr:hypothetical protein [Fibromonadaceae bacterium]
MVQKTSIFTVLLLALVGVSNLVYAVEQKDFYGIWLYSDNVFYEINKDTITVFVMNYRSYTKAKYKYRIVKWKKTDTNEYYIFTLSENNSEKFFRVYIENGAYDMYIDSEYTEGNGTKKSSVEELNKAIKNTKARIEDAPKKEDETEPKTETEIKTEIKSVAEPVVPPVKAKVSEAYKTISIVEARMPAEEVKVKYSTYDSRDGKTYKVVKIGSQTWMAENLNYDAKDSKCYGNNEGYCQKYGRLYNWATAKTACPNGWHLPTEADWTQLTKYLKSEDVFFAPLGGLCISIGGRYYFRAAGYRGNWWSATEQAKNAYIWNINLNDNGVYKASNNKIHLFSVRCIQD